MAEQIQHREGACFGTQTGPRPIREGVYIWAQEGGTASVLDYVLKYISLRLV